MGRPRLIVLLVGVASLAALLAPASAVAGTFNWTLPNDFTTTSPGSNPEHKYGAVSWSYEVDGTDFPASDFSTNPFPCMGAGWTDGSNCISDSDSAISMQAAFTHSVAITWTNPFPSTQTVSVASTLTPALLCTVTQSPAGSSVTLAPGARITWTLGSPLVPLALCTASGGVQVSAATPGPMITLNSLGNAPLHTSSPQLSGTAGTGFSDASQVTVNVYSGTSTGGTPMQTLTGAVGAGGQFSVQVSPALSDGQYTAVASQASGAGTGQSPVMTFRIKVHPPALTLVRPPGNVLVSRHNLTFSGNAGAALGDSSTVTLYLYRGTGTGGRLVGRRDLTVHGASWSTGWSGLKLGYYTAVAQQSDDAGHTTRTPAHTFRLIPRVKAFGPNVTVGGGQAGIAIGCFAGAQHECRGTVLVVTKGSYSTSPGGPTGPLELLFAHVRIPGQSMAEISGRVAGSVIAVLRHLRHTQLEVTAKLSTGFRSVSRPLRIG